MSAGAPLLAAREAGRRFGARVGLHPSDFEAGEGEAIALIGPNGAGKSTLLALLAGAIPPSEGRVEQRKGIRVGWAPQRPALYGRLTPRENLELFARLEREPDPRAAAARLLDSFQLPGDAVPSAGLSAGNLQRLNLALALLGNPHVLLLDEPTASLDPAQRRRFWSDALETTERGGAVVFATQSKEEPEELADRVVVLLAGSIVFQGAPGEVDREWARV